MYRFLHSNKTNCIDKTAQIAFCSKKNMCVNASESYFSSTPFKFVINPPLLW